MQDTATSSIRTLSVFSLVMITVGSVGSIRNLPATALFGNELIFFLAIGALFFLLPSALISAELSSAWPEHGGIYVWVREAFGRQTGFLAIWFQWIQNVVWYPTLLSFIAGALAYLIAPDLASNRTFIITVIICAFWSATIINLLGIKSSARFASFCAIAGLILPMILIITLGVLWIVLGRPLQISFAPHNLIPNLFNMHSWIAMTAVMTSFCGIEVATVHARDVKNPQKTFPTALLVATIMIFITLVGGSLAIAIVLPEKQISLIAGIMQAFAVFFSAYHLEWLVPIVALSLVIGSMGGVSNWIIAPTRGLSVAAQDGHLPKAFQQENRYGAPAWLLIFQAILVTIAVLTFFLMPSINASYWLLTALAIQLYMGMYILMFAAGIYLRYSQPERERPFRIPGKKNFGMLLVGGGGILGGLITIAVSFLPPDAINIVNLMHYEMMMLLGLVIVNLPPVIIFISNKRK